MQNPTAPTPIGPRMTRPLDLLGLALTFCLLAIPEAAAAQDVAVTESDRRLAALFGGLAADEPVRVATPSTFIEADHVQAVAGDHVELAGAGGSVDVDFADIRNVAVRDNHWLQGTLWGAGAGILVGGVTGMLISSFDCDTPTGCTEEERAGMVTWGAILGGAGAIGGFVIGRHSFYWQPIFP